MPIVRIARHGETTWNAVGRYQGRIDTQLSPLGEAQAHALGVHLRDASIARIVSSPLARCVETARPLSAFTGVAIESEPLLLEIAHGTWEGRYREEIAGTEPELFRRWREYPEQVRFQGGESLADVLARWQAFLAKSSFDCDTLIVTHDVMVRIALLERSRRGIEQLRTVRALNAAYSEYEVEGAAWTVRSECVSSHLSGLNADPERQAL